MYLWLKHSLFGHTLLFAPTFRVLLYFLLLCVSVDILTFLSVTGLGLGLTVSDTLRLTEYTDSPSDDVSDVVSLSVSVENFLFLLHGVATSSFFSISLFSISSIFTIFLMWRSLREISFPVLTCLIV